MTNAPESAAMNTTRAARIRRVCRPFRFETMPPTLVWAAGVLLLVLTILGVGLAAAWLGTEVLQNYIDWLARAAAPQ